MGWKGRAGGIFETRAWAGGLKNGGLIGGGGFGLGIGGRLGGGFGDGGGELLCFDGIFVGEEGRGQLGNSLARGKGEGTVTQACAFGGLGKLLGNFFVGIEGRLGFIIAAKNFRKFQEKTKSVFGILLIDEVEVLLVKLGGIFFLIEIAVDVSRALQNDFVFGKFLQELIDGGSGLGDGTGVGEEAGFAQAEPRKIG